MKRKISLSRLLHNDKLMMLVSLLLAILVWALVVFGPSNTQEQVISGVPISVTLNDYAGETLNLRIIEGADATATVKVRGLRSVVSRLSAADITVTADTGNVIKEGTYTLPLRAVSNGDYTIQSVVGPDGNNDTVTISCDVWREAFLPVTVEMPNLTVTDKENYQIGTPVVGNAVLNSEGLITLSGPRTDINRIDKVVAVISDEAAISESTVYTAMLEARDASGQTINSIIFANAEDAKVSVTVPVLVYRETTLTPTVLHTPVGYENTRSLVTVSPSKLELWGVPSEIDDYIASVQQKLTVDFDHLKPDGLTQTIALEASEAIRPVNGEETLTLKVNLTGITTRTFEVALNESTFTATDVPADYAVTAKQTKVTVTLCGPTRTLNNIKASSIRLTAAVPQATAGLQTVQARVSVPNNGNVWAVYADGAAGVEVLVSAESR